MKTKLYAVLMCCILVLLCCSSGCFIDFRFRHCIPKGQKCGEDQHGRKLFCACDKVCRAKCANGKCQDGERCVQGLCVHDKEVDLKLGERCSMGDTCSGFWRCFGSDLRCAPTEGRLAMGEICDGLDNDCNGEIDDGLVRNCKTSCYVPGTIREKQRCVNGRWTPCGKQVHERSCQDLCGTGVQFCYGSGFWGRCHSVKTRPCGSNVGTCQAGVEVCQLGRWSGVCTGAVKKSKEICDGKDNDCNGKIDDGLSCSP